MKTQYKRRLPAGVLLHMAAPAPTHGVHGLTEASHWHTTDTWGFIGVEGALIVALALSRGGKP